MGKILSYCEKMKNGQASQGSKTAEKSAALFLALLETQGRLPLSAIAQRTGLPLSTAHRLASVYLRNGLLARVGHGRYAAGVRLPELCGSLTQADILAAVARPHLRDLARTLNATAHLGVLEGDMVTYLVKEHGGGTGILTQEANQLEGYGTGIGKVLLSALPPDAQAAYLANGPFVALTPQTITDPAALRLEFQNIASQGYAFDNAEMAENLFCLAVPVPEPGKGARCALSVSFQAREPVSLALLPTLRGCAARIAKGLGV